MASARDDVENGIAVNLFLSLLSIIIENSFTCTRCSCMKLTHAPVIDLSELRLQSSADSA